MNIHFINPFMYVHNMYSNMIDKMWNHLSVRWSFYMRTGDGSVVVVKSEPEFTPEFDSVENDDGMYMNDHFNFSYKRLDKYITYILANIKKNCFLPCKQSLGFLKLLCLFVHKLCLLITFLNIEWMSLELQMKFTFQVCMKDDNSSGDIPGGDNQGRKYHSGSCAYCAHIIVFSLCSDYNTAHYLETNLEEVDRSATPVIKRSQIMPEEGTQYSANGDNNSNDWLSCVSKKTGLSRVFLSMLLFMSAMMMIWLCLTAMVTAPEQRVLASSQVYI